MPKVSRTRRSSSPSSASPVRISDAQASVQVRSVPGYSSSKSASTRTGLSEAGEGRLRLFLPRLGVWLGSDIREDLDPRCSLDPGPVHRLAQGRVLAEAGCLLGGGEVVGDEKLIAVVW